MANLTENSEVNEIQERINALPQGGITYKTISGKKYAYYQWRENGKQRARRIKDDELKQYTELIEERKELQKLLKVRNINFNPKKVVERESKKEEHAYKTPTRKKATLKRYSDPVEGFERRECFRVLHDYLHNRKDDRILVIFGLRRTGKTMLIRQAVQEMNAHMRVDTAFIQTVPGTTMEELIEDIKNLEKDGTRYIFIDEISAVQGLPEKAAVLADVFAASGMKIVLSCADTFGFALASQEQLYDRCIFLHTTFLPYRDFVKIYGQTGVDAYIRGCGALTMMPNESKDRLPFRDEKSTDDYIHNAIINNIMHAFQAGYVFSGFRGMKELFAKNDLENFIKREIDEMNFVFAMIVISRVFLAGPDKELSQVVKNLRNLYDHRTIKSREMINVYMYRDEVHQCLRDLDVIKDIDVVDATDFNKKITRTVFTQPGLRYSRAETLICGLLDNDVFRNYSLEDRNRIAETLLAEIRMQMIKDAVLVETANAKPDSHVFVMRFADGEFDMVVADPKQKTCEIYSIDLETALNAPEEQAEKDSANNNPGPGAISLPHAIYDPEKCVVCERRFGMIRGRHLITADNLKHYLLSLGREVEEPVQEIEGLEVTFLEV